MQLPCDDVGSGPAVVLLHAGVADRRMWGEHLDPIADAGYRVIAPDLPGFGDAPASPDVSDWSAVMETMDALGVEEATFVGNSFGGAVALRIAALAPSRVNGLLLVSAPPPNLEPSSQLEAVWETEAEAIDRGDLDAAVDAMVEAWTLPDASPAQRQLVARMQRRAYELQLAIDEPEGAEEPEDPVECNPNVLGTLAMPAVVVAGEHDMPDFISGAEAIAHTLPNARHTIIDGAGHLAPLETPDAFREILRELLETRGMTTRRVAEPPNREAPQITIVSHEDLSDLLPLMRGYCDFYAVEPSDAALLAMSEALIADPQREGVQFLARGQDGKPLGFATLFWTWSTAQAARLGVMNDLFVVPAARGQRVGERLIEACRERCREHGAGSLAWQTALDNARAQRLYDRVGATKERWLDYSLPA